MNLRRSPAIVGVQCESAGGLAQSKTLRAEWVRSNGRQLLECASPLALSRGAQAKFPLWRPFVTRLILASCAFLSLTAFAVEPATTSFEETEFTRLLDAPLLFVKRHSYTNIHESRSKFMRDVTLRNLDIIHFTMTPFLFEPGEDMRLENIKVEDVRIHGEGQAEIIRLKPVVNQYMQKKVPGVIRDVSFMNVVVTGQPGTYGVKLAGADSEHDVREVMFENVSIFGENLTRNAPRVSIGPHVDDVRFAGSAAGGTVKQEDQISKNHKRKESL